MSHQHGCLTVMRKNVEIVSKPSGGHLCLLQLYVPARNSYGGHPAITEQTRCCVKLHCLKGIPCPVCTTLSLSTMPMHCCTSTASTKLCQTAQCCDGSKSDSVHVVQSPETLPASLPTVWRHLLCKLLFQSTIAASQVPAATTPTAL